MKKLLFLFVFVAFTLSLKAQMEVVFDFNNCNEEQPLNGQDGWYVRKHHPTTSGSAMYTGYLGHFWGDTPETLTADETIGVFSTASGTSFGDIATHDISQYGFDFSTGGIIEIECDMWRECWGDLFGIGYDADGDGSVLPPMLTAPGHASYEPIIPDPESTVPDGGIYMMTTQNRVTDPYFKSGVVLSHNTFACEIVPAIQKHWYGWKMAIDLSANNGAGAVTLYMKENTPQGEWEPVPECQGVNAGLTPGSGDKNDPAMWTNIFMLNSGWGGFDNFVVRYIEEGLASQFIDFAPLYDVLASHGPITLEATSTSGLPITFEVAEGPATVDGNILTLTGEDGLVKVRAKQPGDGTQWQAAPSVTRSFYAVDPDQYTPEITIRRPYEGSKVYMPDFQNPVMVVVSAYVEHSNAIKLEDIRCTVDGHELVLKTDYPDNPDNGYWHTTWTPSGEGTYDMTVSVTQTGGKVTTASNTFEVTTNYDDIVVTSMNGDLSVTPSMFTNHGEYVFPTHVNAFDSIGMLYMHNCVNGNCDQYDRVSYCRVKNYRGEWMELYRYCTPFHKECEDHMDATDFTTVLQGLVEFELFLESYDGDGVAPTLVFEYRKGTPDYPYVDMQELWYGTYSFGDYANLCPVPTCNVEFDPCVEKANLRLVTTGHNWSNSLSPQNPGTAYNTGNAAEFYEATHNINVNGATAHTQHLWRTCSPNPAGCQPQGGTWTYSRAGWCPGSICQVWNFSLDNYINAGSADLQYEFDPTYVDECHPNYPDCVNGQNNCPYCEDSFNPILRVSGKLVTYSHSSTIVITDVAERPDVNEEPFHVTLTPNPVKDRLTITTDYEKGRTGVHIINAHGADVRRFSMQGTATVDMSDLPAGIYFVQILGGKMVTKKIIKN